MGRMPKKGVDYFPHDVNASTKPTIFTLESRFGNDGYAFWFKMLEFLGKTEGLYLDKNSKPEWIYLLAMTRVTEQTAEAILGTLAELGAIDAELWEQGIIWSDNFVNRLSDVYRKRGVSKPKKPGEEDEIDEAEESLNVNGNTEHENDISELFSKEDRDVLREYEKLIGQLNSRVANVFGAYDFPSELKIYAIRKAHDVNKRSLSYIEGIFRGYMQDGIKTLADAIRHEDDFRNSKSQGRSDAHAVDGGNSAAAKYQFLNNSI